MRASPAATTAPPIDGSPPDQDVITPPATPHDGDQRLNVVRLQGRFHHQVKTTHGQQRVVVAIAAEAGESHPFVDATERRTLAARRKDACGGGGKHGIFQRGALADSQR